jgi:hypothetical protein
VVTCFLPFCFVFPLSLSLFHFLPFLLFALPFSTNFFPFFLYVSFSLSPFLSFFSLSFYSLSSFSSLSFVLFLEGLRSKSRNPHSNIQAVYPQHTRPGRSKQAASTHPYRYVSQSVCQSVSQSVSDATADMHCCSYVLLLT